MAFSAADLSADELAWAALDKPILGHNAAAVVTIGATSRWVDGVAGDFADADISDSDYPITKCLDGLPGMLTKPATSAPLKSNYTLCIDMGAAGIDFDGILYLNHNLYSVGCTAVEVDIDDANTFPAATNVSTLDPSAGSDNSRLADLVLESGGGTARRYSSVRWVRITMAKGAAFSALPYFGQLIFLRRRQFERNPNRPTDPTDQESKLASFRSDAGVDYDSVRYEGMRNLDFSFDVDQAAQQADILAWWTATKHGTSPFIWIDDPASSPAAFVFAKRDEPSLQFPYVTWSTRAFNLVGHEQGPTFAASES